MLAVTHLTQSPPGPEDSDPLAGALTDLLDVLAQRPGFGRGHVGRALDDATRWVLVTEWEDVGSYRRGLSSYDVKVAFAAVMPHVRSEPSAFEVLTTVSGATAPRTEARPGRPGE